jgi:uncharacterized membrane protein
MTTLHWLPPYNAAVYVGLLAACAIVLWLARRWASSPLARSWHLILIRAAVLGMLIVLLMNPTEVKEIPSPPHPAEMVYLVDCSQSMGLDRPISRLDQVKETIRQSNPANPSQSSVRLSMFRFGRQLAAVSSLEELRAEDDATQLLNALERLPTRFGGNRPAGVVVFSDGRTTETDGFKEAAEGYRKWKVPLHVVPMTDRGMIGDVAIQELVVPRSAPPGTKVPVHVQISSYGFNGRRAEIRVRPANNQWARPLAAMPVTLAGGPQTHDLLIEPDPTTGEMVIEVTPLAGEAITENNQVPFRIASVLKKLRVIYMEATPSEEYHWLRDALAEDPNIECLAMEVQTQYVSNQRLHRVGDYSQGYPKTREELFKYDVIICSDISRVAFTQEQLEWTVELVAQRGGGFAMVGGNTSFGAGQWDLTIWDQMIPVKMSGERPGSLGNGYTYGDFRVVVPAAAERHPIWRIAEDPRQNIAILNRMPGFHGTNLIDRVKPGATVLGISDRRIPLAGVMPVFACQSFGKGRTFAMMTDTTSTWGAEFESEWGEGDNDNRYYRKFWRNTVKWLAENSIGGNQRLRTETDKVIYRPGQPIQVTAHAYKENLEEAGNFQVVARLKTAGRAEAGQKVDSSFVVEETPLSPGGSEFAYRGKITAPTISALKGSSVASSSSLRSLVLEVIAFDQNRVVGREELDLQILDDSAEFHDLQPDPKRLEEIADLSDGKVLHNTQELSGLLESLKASPGESVISRQPAWDRAPFWCLLLVLLAVEWVFRRYRGLA